MILYHVTARDNLLSIFEKGLIPSRGPLAKHQPKDGVWFTNEKPEPSDNYYYALSMLDELSGGSGVIILRVEVPDLWVVQDEEVKTIFAVFQVIPPALIHLV